MKKKPVDPYAKNKLVARAVVRRNDLTTEQKREILETLGVIAPGGRELLPDDVTRNSESGTAGGHLRWATQGPRGGRGPRQAPRVSPEVPRDTPSGGAE